MRSSAAPRFPPAFGWRGAYAIRAGLDRRPHPTQVAYTDLTRGAALPVLRRAERLLRLLNARERLP